MPRKKTVNQLSADPLWYQNAVIYQVHVRSFFDGNGDGIGDFPGLTAKLDYLQDLGVTAIWMLPFYPSPLRDGGYDIADYTGINPEYGTMRDFRALIRQAHARGLRVITEVVINHTSDRHAWFQRARRAPRGSPERDFYVWTDDPEKYSGVRIIFQDFEMSNWSWDPVAQQYYWHRFYHHQPDLNFENPAVHKAVEQVIDFWLGMGVDGLRLDAIPYLYEAEGTNCENLPATHEYLKQLRAHVDAKFPNRMLLAEANMWPEDTRAYFGDGDECHMAFNFPVMPRMYMAVQMEDRYPLVDIMNQTPPIPAAAQWALFLRNHDELTLEMVTDEERDYMYRAYADDPRARINLGIRRRLAPLQKNNRSKIELLNGLLMSLPGTPILYYGDEIGMGDNIYLGDRDGVRTPMQWSADRNAGFSTANPQQLFLPVIIDPEYRYEAINVATQQNNPSSLLVWMRRLIAQRQRHSVFGTGSMTMLAPDNPRVLAFIRGDGASQILVVANLSRFPQPAELDLSDFRDHTPVDAFGGSRFPRIEDRPYQFTLAPHSFLWLQLSAADRVEGRPAAVPEIMVPSGWQDIITDRGARARFTAALPKLLAGHSWFNPKRRLIESVRLTSAAPVRSDGAVAGQVALVEVSYTDGEPETYQLPLAFHPMGRAGDIHRSPSTLVDILAADGTRLGVVVDAATDPAFARAVLECIRRRRTATSDRQVTGVLSEGGRSALAALDVDNLPISEHQAAIRNSAILVGDSLYLKLLRRVEHGVNPEWELGRFLTDDTAFTHVVKTYGALELRSPGTHPRTLAVLQENVVHERDAWDYLRATSGSYLEDLYRVIEEGRTSDLRSCRTLAGFDDVRLPDGAHELFPTQLSVLTLIGERLAQLHHAMAIGADYPEMAPEPFPPHYQRQIYQGARSRIRNSLRVLRGARNEISTVSPSAIGWMLGSEDAILALLEPVKELNIGGLRMRTHGDLHLGQILLTGPDVKFIDFEGRPTRFISQRKVKRSPLRDLAGLCRSVDVVTGESLADHLQRFNVRTDSPAGQALAGGTRFASSWLQAALTQSYLRGMEVDLLTEGRASSRTLMRVFLVEKLGVELQIHLRDYPHRLGTTVEAMRHLLEEEG